MEDVTKKSTQKAGSPGKPAKEVTAGLRKTPKVMNLAGKSVSNKGRSK